MLVGEHLQPSEIGTPRTLLRSLCRRRDHPGQIPARGRAGDAKPHALPAVRPQAHGEPSQKPGCADERMQLPGLHPRGQEDSLDGEIPGELQAPGATTDRPKLGVGMDYRLRKLGQYLRGWFGYFGINQYYRPIPELEE